MFSNYLKIILHKLYREKLYALINISGLAIAIACCVILGLYLRSELTYDRYQVNHERIFRLEREFNINGKINRYAINSTVIGPMLKEDFPEIVDYVRLRPNLQSILIRHGNNAYYWDRTFIADDNIFSFFTHDIIHGNPETALVDPGSVAVSETFARTYFGDENPMGQTISTDTGGPRTITLVFADQPENTHLKYDVLYSYNHDSVAIPDNMTARRENLWGGYDFTYLLMPEGFQAGDFKRINDAFYSRHAAEQGRAAGTSFRTWLTPLADIHLDSSDLEYDVPGGNKLYLYGFAAVAVFILLVACINYMNLATARAAKRAKEVGMHKILGAGRGQLIMQFLGESLCFTFIALLFGIVLVEIALQMTLVTTLLDKPLSLDLFREPELLAWLAGLGLLIGTLAGVYPAIYLSSMLPLSALVGSNKNAKANIRFREGLVLVQFVISVGVIACTLLMAAQMRYVSSKSLGFNKENLAMIRLQGLELIDKIPTMRNELLKNNRVLDITSAPRIMGQGFPTFGGQAENNEGEMVTITTHNSSVDDNFIDAMGLELIAGRDFSKKFLSDSGANFVVNEAVVRMMGWTEPVGKRFQSGPFTGRVIGVVKDFNFKSLHSPVEPFVLTQYVDKTRRIPAELLPNPTRMLVLKIAGENIRETLKFIEEKFAEFDPTHPFEFEFLDDTLSRLYLSEQRLMKLIGVFAGICIFIACMGLFGLAAFTTEQRTKEIGIRKVLGATTAQIIFMLSRGILILVLIGSVVASLMAWYAMDEWLAGFAYRTEINPLVFLLSATLAAAIAFITLALQSLKTARSNPVQALRYE
ncbi:MAG: ABC transporter permease [Gammaproteobacteria bacterium]|nr:MAG: ABC transporter permease [Gammaproteobacteria bacterium]